MYLFVYNLSESTDKAACTKARLVQHTATVSSST